MKAVFLDLQTFSKQINTDVIDAQVESLVCYQLTSQQEVVERCADADIIITNKVVIDRNIIKQLGKLKLICVAATGTNNIDIKAAQEAGIAVANVANYAGTAVAQYIFSQLLEHFQHVSHHNNNVEQGKWHSSKTFSYLGNSINELAGKTLGLIGYGHIGERVKAIAEAFEMQVLIAERKDSSCCRFDRTPFEQVLQQSDIISLHCPLTDDTYHLIDKSSLELMRSDALLINTARGDIVDEQALINALKDKNIAKAIVDVVSKEPPTKDCLLANQQLPNLVVTAHIAWASLQAQQRIIDTIATNINQFKST